SRGTEQASEIASLPKEERQIRIEGMVASLAAKLDEDPSDKTGWRRLIRSYMVLGLPSEAQEAFQNAERAHPEDEKFLAELSDLLDKSSNKATGGQSE
ncbi:MAG: hypothetical protein AAF412_05825, partial [Pseudomonadota bacterium]